MKKMIIIFIVFITSCTQKTQKLDNAHVEKLAINFMKTEVIPQMKDPRPYEVSDASVVVKKAADLIHEYKFTYDNLSLNKEDSIAHKRHLDSVMNVYPDKDMIISITVNVAYKTRYRRGNVVTDSIKLGYDPTKDKVSYWPF